MGYDPTPIVNAIVWISALLDCGVGLAVLFSRRKDGTTGWSKPLEITPRRLAVVLAVGTAMFVAKLPLLVGAGMNVFGILHAIYAALVLGLPVGGLALLVAERMPPATRPFIHLSRTTRLAAVAMCVPGVVGIYATHVEPYRLQLETAVVSLPDPRHGSEPLRIGVLADIQTERVTDYEFSAVRRVMQQSPDVILLPGDLFQSDSRAYEHAVPVLRELLGHLSAPGGVYFVLGDVDHQEHIQRVLAGTNVRLLMNEVAQTTVRGRTVTIGGIELEYRTRQARETVQALEAAPGQDDVRLLITHRPDPVLDLPPNTRIDLVVAGHTHGGQVHIPLIGPVITLSNVPNRVAGGGLHELDGARRIYVSRGVGIERDQAPRLRFLCPPEISLLTLQ